MSFAGFTHPDKMTRSKHLQMIRFIYKSEGRDAAIKYWLNHCPRISRKAFEESIT